MENGGCNYSLCIEEGMSLNNAERYCTHFTTDISSELPSGIIQDLFLDMISITSISFLCPSFPHTLLLFVCTSVQVISDITSYNSRSSSRWLGEYAC